MEERQPLVVVTGASSGIGAALAAQLARPNLSIGLVGRDRSGLAATAEAVRAAGGSPLVGALDLTTGAFAPWLEEVVGGHDLIALYANAGVSAGPRSGALVEEAADAERLIATNLTATIASVSAAAPAMRRDGDRSAVRRIGIVSSIAGLFPTADLAVYSATKAGLIAYAHAVRPRLKRAGISVTVACPGFVTTPMSARHHGAKPFEMSVERAAGAIVRAVESGRRTCVFPFPYALAAWLAPLAPGLLLDAILPRFAADIAQDPRTMGR